jgi:hypothetical protein
MQEALAIGFGGGVLGALDGDQAAEGGIARAIDLAHAAGAEAGFDVEAAGEDAIDSGEQFGARAHVTFERRRVLHFWFCLRVGVLS